MSRTELVSMIGQLSEYQVEQIRKMAEEFLIVQEELSDTTPKSCPCCNSASVRFIKKGFSGRKQRYQCIACGKKFTYDAGKITAYSHQSEDKWVVFIEDTLSLKTLDQCAEHISARDVQIERINDLQDYIKKQRANLAEFDETLVKRWLKQITVWEDHFTVELKSGLKIDIEG